MITLKDLIEDAARELKLATKYLEWAAVQFICAKAALKTCEPQHLSAAKEKNFVYAKTLTKAELAQRSAQARLLELLKEI